MNQTYYLVDTNALTTLTRRRIRSHFFSAHCRVSTDVLSEVPGHPDEAVLAGVELKLTPDIIEQIRAVMATVDAADTSLVDLYKNKGMADPGLIASVRDSIAHEEGKLLPDVWVLVTNDGGVESMAAQHDVPTIKPDVLAALIDGRDSW